MGLAVCDRLWDTFSLWHNLCGDAFYSRCRMSKTKLSITANFDKDNPLTLRTLTKLIDSFNKLLSAIERDDTKSRTAKIDWVITELELTDKYIKLEVDGK